VHLIGGELAPGVKEGGVLSQPLREIQVEALPLEVPEHIDLDVSHMATGDTLRISDIVVREGVTFLDDPDTVVATLTAPTRAIEAEEAEAAEAAAEAAEGEEGEAVEGEAAEGEAAPGDDAAESTPEG
jgi:large subunit ribosomal protein L25